MFLMETWQKEEEFIYLKELCADGCLVFGPPHPSCCRGGLAVVQRDSFTCRVTNIQTLVICWFINLNLLHLIKKIFNNKVRQRFN